MAQGTHDFEDDPRNETIRIWVNGELLAREHAVVSVFDSGFVLGDGIWEGLRVRGGHPAFLDAHLDRLYEGAQAIVLDVGLTREELTAAIYATLRANEMVDGVHVRLMVTRGIKRTPYQDPRVTVGPATVVIIAEHKQPLPATATDGITLFTTHVRRATPDTLDPKLNSHSKLNDITACIQAYTAGADEALMLDPQGFVATGNSTHFFVVKGTAEEPEVWTSDGRFCLGGITRSNVLRICRDAGIGARETTFSLTDVYSAREAFVTGTFAGVVPVRTIDGRTIGTGARGPVVERLQRLYAAYLDRTGIDHPMREEVIASQPTDLRAAIAGLSAPLPDGRQVHYAKHMTHHVSADMDLGWTLDLRNVLLIRHPGEVVASYVRSRESCEPDDIGLPQQGWLMELWDRRDAPPPIIDATDFLAAPEAHLRWLCDWLGIDFTDRMLSWPAGPRASDGVWAPHWYEAVWRSTGFEPPRRRVYELSAHDAAVAAACQPVYDALYERRVRV